MIFRIPAKNVANITKDSFHFSRLTFCRKNVFGENEFNTCGFSGKKPQNFVGKMCTRNFWGNKFCKKGNTNHFLTLGEKVSNFPKSSQQSCHNGSLRIQRMNSRKNFGSIQFSVFLGHRAKLFGLYATSFLQDYQLCILLAHREFLGEICVWNLCFTFTDFKR